MMTENFTIKSPDGPCLVFSSLTAEDAEGWANFVISLENAPVGGTVKVSDLNPKRWSDFFCHLSESWRGWKGEKAIGSVEEDLTLKATIDSLGHVYLRVILHASPGMNDWHVEGTLVLEAGALEPISKGVKRFFSV